MDRKISFYNRPIVNIKPSKALSLAAVYDMIRSDQYTSETNHLREIADNNEAREYKSHSFDYVTFSGRFKTRNEKGLIDHSGFLTLDFDHINDPGVLKRQLLEDPKLITALLFRSPSGNGLKWVIPIDLSKGTHRKWFQAVSAYIKSTYGIEIDPSGKDISRACFLCYDPDAYINPDFLEDQDDITDENSQKSFNPQEWLAGLFLPQTIPQDTAEEAFAVNMENWDKVNNIVAAIENEGVDITSEYQDWVNIGFALAEEFREEGREFFHRVSRFYPDYSKQESDKQYDECLKAGGEGITIGTFFFLAKNSVNVKTELETINVKENNPGVIPDNVFDNLPVLLREITEVTDRRTEKDILLLGSITTLSACLPNIYGIYSSKKVYSNLFFYLQGMAGSGKAVLDHCKHLAMPIHEQLKAETQKLKIQYKEKYSLYKKNGNGDNSMEKPEAPPEKMLIFPANNSSSGTYQLLDNNNGCGLIFETEGDTLADSFNNKEYGNYSDGFRKAFHHEAISLFRKTNSEHIEIRKPKLSAVLSGTPRQTVNLIKNAENGLLSRFIYYSIPMNTEWKDVFKKTSSIDLDEYFHGLGKKIHPLYQQLITSEGIEFILTSNQQVELNRNFESKQEIYSQLLGDEFIASVRRMGIISFRIAMIFSIIRHIGSEGIPSRIICDDQDFINSLAISDILLEHARFVFQSMPNPAPVKRNETQKELFFRSLPEEFNSQEYKKVAGNIGLNIKTAEGYVKKFCDSNLLNHFKHNLYQKQGIGF